MTSIVAAVFVSALCVLVALYSMGAINSKTKFPVQGKVSLTPDPAHKAPS